MISNFNNRKLLGFLTVILASLLIYLYLSSISIQESNKDVLNRSTMVYKAMNRLLKTREKLQGNGENDAILKIIRANASIPAKSNIRCDIYNELRHVIFTDKRVSKQLCVNAEAYKKLSNGKYPICQLSHDSSVMTEFMQISKNKSVFTFLVGVKKEKISMVTYPNVDFISRHILSSHMWEPALVSRIVSIAKMFTDITFVDAGSNIGVFTVSAASQGLNTVSLDANIRNLLRLRLSLMANKISPTNSILLWNFIANSSQLQYLNLPGDCNVGASGGTKRERPIADTIPIMPVAADEIGQFVKTKHIAMKIDIEGGEAAFVSTADSLFKNFTIVAVQMEFIKFFTQGNTGLIANFFINRDYQVFSPFNLKQLDASSYKSWDGDVLWIRKDFVKKITGK